MGHQHFLENIPLFQGLSDTDINLISTMTTEHRLKRGDVVFYENDPGDALYVVQQGHIRIYSSTADGREKTLALLGQGDFFGEMALIDGEPRSAVAQASEPTVLLRLHQNAFHRLLSTQPHIARSIIECLAGRLRQMNKQLMDVVFLDVRSRVIETLLDLDITYGKPHTNGRLINLKLTHQELAAMVGTSRESITRVLSELQDSQALQYVDRFMWLDTQVLSTMLS